MATYRVETTDGSVYEVDVDESAAPVPQTFGPRTLGRSSRASAAYSGPQPPSQNFIADLLNTLLTPQNVGGSIGAAAGSFTPFPVAGPIAGAALGQAGGEALDQILQQMAGAPQAPDTSGESVRRLLTQGAIGGGAEAAGIGLSKLGARASAFLSSPESRTAIAEAADLGIPLTAGQATGSKMLLRTEDVLPQVIGGGKYRQFEAKQAGAITESMSRLLRRIGPEASREEVGSRVETAIAKAAVQRQAVANQLYDAVQRVAGPDPIVPTKTLRSAAQELMDAAPKSAAFRESIERKFLPDLLDTEKLANHIPMAEASRIRSVLGDIARGKGPVIPDLTQREASILKAAVTDDINSVQGGAVGIALKEANDYYAREIVPLKTGLLAKFSGGKLTPEQIADRIVQPGSVSVVRELKGAVDATTFDYVKRNVIESLLDKATDSSTGDFSAKLFLKALDKAGDDSLTELLGAASLAALHKFARGAFRAQKSQGQILSQPLIGVAGLAGQGALLYRAPIRGFGLVGGNWLLARLLTNGTAVRLMANGWTSGPISARVAGQLSRIIAQELSGETENRRIDYESAFRKSRSGP